MPFLPVSRLLTIAPQYSWAKQNCTYLQVLEQAYASSAVHMIIVSDANSMFIDKHILQAQGLQVSSHLSEVPNATRV